MTMALGFGPGGVDWQHRIDYERLRRTRLAKTQAALKEAGIAAAVLMRPDNIRFTTGLKGPEFVAQLRYVLVFAEHEPVVYELGNLLARQRENAPWIPEQNWRFSYCWLQGIAGREATQREARRFADGIVRDLKERGVFGEKLGTDGVDDAARQALADAGVQLTGVGSALLKARRNKTEDELNCLRMANTIANAGFARLWETLKPGVRERDIGGQVYEAMTRAGAEAVTGTLKTGPYTFDLNMNGNTDRLVEVGDLGYQNVCRTTFNGYKVCIYRSFIVGRKPNARERDWYRRMYDRVYAVISEIKPGATTADAARHLLPAREWGYDAEQPLLVAEVGHGYGMGYEEPVISRIFSLDYPQPIEPGMVIAVECREGERGYGGVRLEEMVAVTDTGTELLTTWPSDDLYTVGAVAGL
jgi:Xaa-Pro aminopeptidase